MDEMNQIGGNLNGEYKKHDLCRLEYNPKQPEIFHVCDAKDLISNEARQFGWRVLADHQPYYIIKAFIEMADREIFVDDVHITFGMLREMFNDWLNDTKSDN